MKKYRTLAATAVVGILSHFASGGPMFSVSAEVQGGMPITNSGPFSAFVQGSVPGGTGGSTTLLEYAAIAGDTGIAGPLGAPNGRTGLGVDARASVNGSGSAFQTVSAALLVDDLVIESAGSSPLGTLTTNFELSGTERAALNVGMMIDAGWAIELFVTATLNGETVEGAILASETVFNGPTESQSGILTSLFGDDFSATFTDVPVNTPLTFELELEVFVGAFASGGSAFATADYLDTLQFEQDEPVFTSDDSDFLTAGSPSLQIVDNRAIPAPATVAMALLAVGAGARRKR